MTSECINPDVPSPPSVIFERIPPFFILYIILWMENGMFINT